MVKKSAWLVSRDLKVTAEKKFVRYAWFID